MPNSFVFDPNRCTGCGACRLACTIENGLGPSESWRRVETFNPRHHPRLPLFHLSLACNHCEHAACMDACPTLAYARDDVTGAVLLDPDKCMGCGYCSWACPYDAPVFDEDRGVMTKCTFCVERLHQGMKPACASLCPTGALDYADVPDEELGGEIAGFPQTDLGPRIKILRLEEGRRLPEMTAEPPAEVFQQPAAAPSRISLRSEWSLAAFTFLSAVLAALVGASAAGALSAPAPAFLAGAVLAMGLATVHLGQPLRAYRAILNLRRSWLSREIVSFSVFAAFGTLYLWRMPDNLPAGVAAAALGLVTLFCADRVYGVLRLSGPGYRHSAGAMLTGIFLGGVFAGSAWVAAPAGLLKLELYGRRRGWKRRLDRVRTLLAAARFTFGMLIPLALWVVDLSGFHAMIVASVLVGELIDRGEYYEGLESESPGRQMEIDLEAALAVQRSAS